MKNMAMEIKHHTVWYLICPILVLLSGVLVADLSAQTLPETPVFR